MCLDVNADAKAQSEKLKLTVVFVLRVILAVQTTAKA